LRRSIADDEPLPELGHRVDVAALGRDCELVDCFAVSTRSIVLRGNRGSVSHRNIEDPARREPRLEGWRR
jgi:hypothetical protein